MELVTLTLEMCDAPMLFVLIGGGCREADVGSNAPKVGLLEAKV